MLARERDKKEHAELVEKRKRWEKGDFSKTKKELKKEAEQQRKIEEEESDSDEEKSTDGVGLKLIRQMKEEKPKIKGRDALNTPDNYAKNLVDVCYSFYFPFFFLTHLFFLFLAFLLLLSFSIYTPPLPRMSVSSISFSSRDSCLA